MMEDEKMVQKSSYNKWGTTTNCLEINRLDWLGGWMTDSRRATNGGNAPSSSSSSGPMIETKWQMTTERRTDQD